MEFTRNFTVSVAQNGVYPEIHLLGCSKWEFTRKFTSTAIFYNSVFLYETYISYVTNRFLILVFIFSVQFIFREVSLHAIGSFQFLRTSSRRAQRDILIY